MGLLVWLLFLMLFLNSESIFQGLERYVIPSQTCRQRKSHVNGLEGYAEEFFFLVKLFPCLLFLVKLFLHVSAFVERMKENNQLYFCLLKFHKFVSVSDKQSRLYSVIADVHITFFFWCHIK